MRNYRRPVIRNCTRSMRRLFCHCLLLLGLFYLNFCYYQCAFKMATTDSCDETKKQGQTKSKKVKLPAYKVSSDEERMNIMEWVQQHPFLYKSRLQNFATQTVSTSKRIYHVIYNNFKTKSSSSLSSSAYISPLQNKSLPLTSPFFSV